MESPSRPPDEHERYLENLRLVAKHRAEPAPSGTSPASRSRAGAWARWGALGVAAAFLLGKGKLLLGLLKFAKLGTLVTMVASVWAYTLIWDVAFALGFVLLIFVHEAGHALAMRRQGIRAGAPVFIPFVGAVIAMKEMPRNAYVESIVAIGGPALGTAGAIACLLAGAATGSPFWYALASTGFLINLFNMIPVSPLDGGRVVGVIGRWTWVAGYAVGIAAFAATRSPILFIILLLGLLSLRRSRPPGYDDVPASARRTIGLAYFGLLVVMALGMWTARRPLEELGIGV